MSLRIKLLIVLLFTAILPMLAVRALQAVSIYRLQDKVATDMRERLNREAEQDMLRAVDGYADSLEKEAELGFALLKVQQGRVERGLMGPPRQDGVRVPTVAEFAEHIQTRSGPWSVQLSERHAVLNDDGGTDPQPVSYDTQVVLIHGDGEPTADQRDDLQRMSTMTRFYRELYDKVDDTILWQYTSLESGLHFTYPGKAGLPPGYNPQRRSWYENAIRARRPTASRPYIDASTGQLVITFATPVMGRDRKAGGVTAIDLRVSRLLDPEALNTEWARQARVMVVAAYPARLQAQATGPGRDEDNADPLGRGDPERFAPQPGERPADLHDSEHQADADPRIDQHPDAHLRQDNRDPLADTSFPPDVYIVADVKQQQELKRRLARGRTVDFDNPQDRQAVTEDLLSGRHGVRRVSIEGEDVMIAYGQVGADEHRPVFAFISAPTRTIFAPAESAITGVREELRASLVNTGGILVLLVVGVGIIAVGMSRQMTRPITEMAVASHRVANGDLEARVQINRRDELGQLGKAFNEMVPALRDRMKIRESLHVAMQVQQSLLPNNAPSIPGLDIAGHSEYCDETGGDYYDFIQLDRLGPNHLAVAVGDVTGHGIAAALLMATGRALIRSHADQPGSLGEVFTRVNRQLCNAEFTGRFMTLMYLVVSGERDDQGRVHVRYLSAGHDPLVVYRPSQDTFIELAGHDIPLGIDADWSFNERTSDALRPGDVLVAGTDGIWECFNPRGEQFGKDRMCQTIRAAAAGSSEQIAKAISDACHQWRGEREQNDDITLVVIKLVD